MVSVATKPRLTVVQQSEFLATCECEDWWRHKDRAQSHQDFRSRKERSGSVKVTGYKTRHGLVIVAVTTSDRQGERNHEVRLSRGYGEQWCCKHIIQALRSSAIMPDHKVKDVFPNEAEAKEFVRSLNREDALTAAVNNVVVVGWHYEAGSSKLVARSEA